VCVCVCVCVVLQHLRYAAVTYLSLSLDTCAHRSEVKQELDVACSIVGDTGLRYAVC